MCPCHRGEGGSYKVFQIVDMKPRPKKQPFVVDWSVYAVPRMVQHCSVFRGPDRPDAAPESLQIFREGAPELMDLLSVTPFRHLADHSVVWEQVGVGEMAGYLRLRQPRREWPGDARTPVYALMKVLVDRGWRPGRTTGSHTADSERTF